MATPFQFWPPANQQDFPNDPAKQALLVNQWNINLDGFTQQGINGNPWNSTNASGITNYFNPLDTPIPPGVQPAEIIWGAFPGRISYYFPNLSANEILSLGDTGYQTNGSTFANITNPCTGDTTPYGPYGPRGWQDEYCEWAVTRDGNKNIIRIDFTCENPEYWNSLWMVDPEQVLSLYQQTLNKPQIVLSDLYLVDGDNNPVIDPSTGNPVYNPLNKWNSGPFSSAESGGAMHLTSTPNTIQTEIGLATAATIQRTVGNSDPTVLLCCAQYGQPHRNSDPNIGQNVNEVVSGNATVTLTNPPGLYIQWPAFELFTAPNGADPASFWTIARGCETLNDINGNPLPGNYILHAVYEVPSDLGFTVSDIKINGQPITWGGQVAQTFNMHIVATGLPMPSPPVQGCAGNPAISYAQPLQLFYASVFNAMASTNIPNPVNQPMALISNSTLIAPVASPGTTADMVITTATVVADPNDPQTWPAVTFDTGDITASVTAITAITYAVPGNSYPSPALALAITVTIGGNASAGLHNVYVTNNGQAVSVAMPALLNIV